MKSFMKKTLGSIKVSAFRFPSASALIALLFLTGSYIIVLEPDSGLQEILGRVMMASFFGILLCVLGAVILERSGNAGKRRRLITEAALVLLSAGVYPLLHCFNGSRYITAGYFGALFALFLFILFFAGKQEISNKLSFIMKNTVFNWLVCGIVTAGTALCIFAFDALIYQFSSGNIWKVYGVVVLFVWAVLFANLSLSTVPPGGGGQGLHIPKLFRIIVLFVMLPLYLLLALILYIYLGKILVTLSFPSGRINWFASCASLFFIFFVFALSHYREENRFAKVFVRFGGFGLIPIIIMQFAAMYIRLYHYGLTSSRYVSLAFNVFALAFACITLIRNGKYVKYTLPAAAGLGLLLTVTPLNLFDVPVWNQQGRLIAALERNGMIADGKVEARKDVPKEDRIRITSAYDYLSPYPWYDYLYPSDGGMYDNDLPDAVKDTDRAGFENIFGFGCEYEESWRNPLSYETNRNYIYYQNDFDFLDVADYSRLHTVSGYKYDEGIDSFIFMKDDGPVAFDLLGAAGGLYGEYGDADYSYTVRMEFEIGADRLILTSLNFYVEEREGITVTSYSGYFLER